LSSTKYEACDDSYNWQFLRRICVVFTMHMYGTGEVCSGTVLEVNVEVEGAANPGTAKHQMAPLYTCELEDCHVMLLELKHKLGHVALPYSP
jgi:hypothetical protein